MISLILLMLVALWVWWKFQGEERNRARVETGEFNAKIAERYRIAERLPDSPTVWENLGDVLRQADRYAEAVAVYERAEWLIAQDPSSQGNYTGGGGLENKLRLSRVEALQGGMIGVGEAARIGQQICRQCGRFSDPKARLCAACGDLLPVDTMRQAWESDIARKPAIRDALEVGAMGFVVMLAIAMFDLMPLDVKGVLLISTVIVVGWKFLRMVGGK